MTLFRLDASINPGQSASRAIADIVEAEWYQAYPGDTMIRRHVGTGAACRCLGARRSGREDSRSGPQRKPARRGRAGRPARRELAAADAVLLAVPLYHFGVSQHIKTWIDLVIAAPGGGGGAGPLLAGKPAVLVAVRGGAYGTGTPRKAGTTPLATCGASLPTCGVPS